MSSSHRITTCLWFDTQAEEAANYYTGIFKNSRTTNIGRYWEGGKEIHGRQAGSVMIVVFELDGQPLTALNGGPHFQFTPAISMQVSCKNQAEVDHYWDKLSAGGDPNSEKSQRAMTAMMQQKKPDIAAMQRAYDG